MADMMQAAAANTWKSSAIKTLMDPVLGSLVDSSVYNAPGSSITPASDTPGLAAINEEQVAPAPHCAMPGCKGRSLYPFESGGACSPGCLQQLLREAVAEEQRLAHLEELEAKPRVKLGRILIEQGTINEAQLEQALRSQKATGAGLLGCWLKQQVHLPEAEFTAALSIQWKCPVFRSGTFAPARMAAYLPRPLIEAHGALPLRVTGSPERLSLCFEDHVDYPLMHAAERMHGISVDGGLLTATEFWQVTRELLSVRAPTVTVLSASSTECMTEAMARSLASSDISGCRLVAVHDCFWLRTWIKVENPDHSVTQVVQDLLCTIRQSSGETSAPAEAQEIDTLVAAIRASFSASAPVA